MNNPLYIGNQNKDIYDSQADDSNLSEKSVNSIVNLLVLEQGSPTPGDTVKLKWSPNTIIRSLKSKFTGKQQPVDSNDVQNENKGTSCTETLMHMIKANIGPGLLAIPLAFKNAGIILGTVGLLFMALVCLHCIHILLKSYKHVIKKQPVKEREEEVSTGYEHVVGLMMVERFGSYSKVPHVVRIITTTFLIISQIGFCCVYFVFIPSNIEQVVEHYYPHLNLSVEAIMGIVLVPMILFCMIRNLRILAPFSTFANVLMIGSVCVILYSLFDGDIKPYSELELVAPVNNWPTFFSSAVYAFEGIGCVLPLYHGMDDKVKGFFKPINGVLNTAMSLVSIMYYAVGLFGYMKYGSACEPSITLNLPVENIWFQMVKICFAIAVFITFNLQFMVGCDILWQCVYRSSSYLQALKRNENLISGNNNSNQSNNEKKQHSSYLYNTIETVFRSAIILFTFSLAIFIPKIDLFIGLIGAVGSSILAIILPVCLDHMVFWPMENYSGKKLAKNIIIFLFGLYIFIAGTYTSLNNIIVFLMTGK